MDQTPASRTAAAQAVLDRFSAGDAGRSVALTFNDAPNGPATPTTLHDNGDVVRPVASVIKVALVIALYDGPAAGNLDVAEQVPLSALGETRYCSIMKAFDRDRSLSLGELAAIALITSDNPVAVLLEQRIGRAAVRDVLLRAGVADAQAHMFAGFREDELGPKNRVNAMAALDILKMFHLLQTELRYRPIITALDNNLRNARIPALLPDDAVIAHKTGSLEGVVNDAGIVRLGDRCFTVAFLCDDQADPLVTSNAIAACSKALFDLLLARDRAQSLSPQVGNVRS